MTKGGKRYFMTLIDDASRYCYVYLLKTKDEALDYFEIFKAEAENQLERKIKRLGQIVVENIFLYHLISFVRNMVLFTRGHRPILLNPTGLPRGKKPHID
jgi:hypothetical protein